MAKDQLRDFHLFAIESVLPFGMGIVQNAKNGGLKQVLDVLRSEDPFSSLQNDGENSAKNFRDKIDELVPGLGHPVVSVDVTVEEKFSDSEINHQNSLVSTLNKIDSQLDELRHYLDNDLMK